MRDNGWKGNPSNHITNATKNMLLASFTAGLFIDRPMTDNTEGIRRRHHPILTRGRCAACDAAAAAPSAAGGN